ncbi:hypothetical protein L6452_16370 [Arctium lappa]|uniref:Uncharacterized protein n=1 Tax=Arctium lappa TaxID=4217 RepID=A0ACB9C0K8_ARCLA|nr:hypothetical protein L6452_16370 [Arctium lappa]
MGMDGLRGTIFLGSCGFFKRQALLGTPSSVGSSNINQAKARHIGNKSIKSEDILALAHSVAGCRYEENTKWGLDIGDGFKHMNPILALTYAHRNIRPFWAIPIVIYEGYAFLSQFALLNSSSIFPKVSDPWFALHTLLFLVEFMSAGGGLVKWWNDQRMWLVLGVSSYPFAVIDWVFTSLGLSTIEFIVTSKVSDDVLRKRYDAGFV